MNRLATYLSFLSLAALKAAVSADDDDIVILNGRVINLES